MKKNMPLNPLLAAMLLALPSLSVVAQSVAPNAGIMLKQAQQLGGYAPTRPSGLIDAPAGMVPALVSGAPFLVRSIQILGNKKIDTATLHALVADAEGASLTIAQLEKVIFRITEYYNSHGFPLARAIIPAQTIEGGVVKIQIIISRYGKISISNQSRVGDGVLISTLSDLKPDELIEQAGLDRALLLLSDLPGVQINTTVTPGAAAGTSDLKVTATSAPSVTGSVVTDNYGNSFTGSYRVGATVNIANPMGLKNSDNLSVSVLSSGVGMNYARVGYESVVNGNGMRLGGAVSALRYVLGGDVASSDASGTAQVASLWLKQPLVRSRDTNVYAQLQYDGLALKDKTSLLENDRTLSNLTRQVIVRRCQYV
jgi:hemolysin activation/secretion protein